MSKESDSESKTVFTDGEINARDFSAESEKLENGSKNKLNITNQEKYIYLLRNISDVYFELSPDGNILYVNPSFEKISGYSPDELRGRSIKFLGIVPNQVTYFLNCLHVNGSVRDFRGFSYDKCGKEDAFTISAVLLSDENGIPEKIIGVLCREDIKKTSVEEFPKNGNRYYSLVESSETGIFIEKLDGTILHCNSAACAMFGYARNELIGKNARQLLTEEFAGTLPAIATEEMNFHGRVFEGVHKRKDGTLFPTEVDAKIIDVDGEKYLIVYNRDITERKMNEAERENLIRELQTALSEVKTLQGYLPICANCKNIRTDEGYWQKIENYITTHTDVQFSHGICPDCMTKLYPDLFASEEF